MFFAFGIVIRIWKLSFIVFFDFWMNFLNVKYGDNFTKIFNKEYIPIFLISFVLLLSNILKHEFKLP